ncbi:hypothetical protein IWQ60_004244 [Tieghemiomyces parasiticus]|uniref:Mini-chromosome maintenance complex-binding protein n=1 Tax=Tieghemiomyces parasiticus TaxID=78921 RepID=A0A9W8DZJ0_9FUNG|nr:hypothetical protein IWQ60_004244 [Tieghemiomyces parasiticus]
MRISCCFNPPPLSASTGSVPRDQAEAKEAETKDYFCAVFQHHADFLQIPSLNHLDPHTIAPGTLVRFRCMVQDPGYGDEIYTKWIPDTRTTPESRSEAAPRLFCKYTDRIVAAGPEASAVPVPFTLEAANCGEKQLLYTVPIPGEAAWVAKADATGQLPEGNTGPLPGEDEVNSVAGDGEAAQPLPKRLNIPAKTPPAAADRASAIVKIYDTDRCPLVAEAIEVVGVFEWFYPFEGHGDHQLPCIHAIYYKPVNSATLNSDASGGDTLAAEFFLLSTLASVNRVHNMAVGRFVLNLCNIPSLHDPTSGATAATPATVNNHTVPSVSTPLRAFAAAVTATLPFTYYLPLDLDFLNRTAFVPHNESGSGDDGIGLTTGRLQLVTGTHLLVDETAMGNGQLRDRGIINIQALAQILTDLKIEYRYPYQAIEFETNLRAVILSDGKSFLPADCLVPLEAAAAEAIKQEGIPVAVGDDEERAEAVRRYVASCQAIEYTIPPHMAEKIQAAYVEERKESALHSGTKEPLVNQLDLSYKLTLAKLITLSYGLAELTDEVWARTCTLDDQRKERVAAFEKSRTKVE